MSGTRLLLTSATLGALALGTAAAARVAVPMSTDRNTIGTQRAASPDHRDTIPYSQLMSEPDVLSTSIRAELRDWSRARSAETAVPGVRTAMTPARYAREVTRICKGGLLFSGEHQIGTQAGAIAVSSDIRSTGRRRLRRVQAVPRPPLLARTAARWIATQEKLVSLYALTYLRIWMKIEWAYAHHQREGLPLSLHDLLHRPNKLKLEAGKLEYSLGVPDCTGGG
jgi:hypothetical protein